MRRLIRGPRFSATARLTIFVLVHAVLALPPSTSAQGIGGPVVGDSRVGYIDGAIPGTQLRLRFDASYDHRRPTRAEFFWPKAGPGPDTPGPPNPEPSVDYQEYSAYFEALITEGLSGFLETPLRAVNPTVDDNTAGPADMNFGFKYAFLYSSDCVSTFQLRTYVPTGDADRGLGNNHASLEPAVLFYRPLTDRLVMESEFRFWFPLDGTDFAGEMIRYGVGLNYDLCEVAGIGITPVIELVGWTALDGKASVVSPFGGPIIVEESEGDTIVNAKLGVRFYLSEYGDMYIGYGRPWTGDRWYENTFRLVFRLVY